MFVNKVNVSKNDIVLKMVQTIILISWTVNLCVHSSVFELESDYISPDPSLSFLLKQGRGFALLLFQLLNAPLKKKYRGCGRPMPPHFLLSIFTLNGNKMVEP